jgi:molybdenum-dependent DNA-binding transcriptional regulator ModE
MATEVVEIIIREKGAQATSRQISKVGKASTGAAKAVKILVLALAGLAIARGVANVAKGAIDASAAFEQFGIRLGALLGSQKEANIALETFVELSAKTPFAVAQIVEGAATLGAVALGNREKLESLTTTAANLAAVTGLSFKDAAANLQRSLSAGIGAADQFRERGVKELIQSLGDLPDATKASAEELEAAFSKVFGTGGVFGDAAENLSTTLGGALSNIGDATTNLQVALGDAFAPAVINTARQIFIPFLADLQGGVKDSEDAINQFVARAIGGAIEGMILLTQAGLAVIQAFDQIETTVSQGLIDLAGTLVQIGAAGTELQILAQEFVGNSEGADKSRESLLRLNKLIDGFADDTHNAGVEAAQFTKDLDKINDAIIAVQVRLRSTDLTADPRKPQADVDVSGGGGDDALTTQQLTAQAGALTKITALTNSLRIEEAKRIEPLDAELEKLRQKEDRLISLSAASADFTAASEGLTIISEDQARIEEKKTTELQRQKDLEAEITRLLGVAVLLSPELAAEIRKAADAAVDAGGGLEKVNEALADVQEDAEKGIEAAQGDLEGFGDTIGQSIEDSVGTALRQAITGEGVDAMAILADLGAKLVEDSLSSVLDGIIGKLSGSTGEDGSGLGGILGGGKKGGFDLGGAITAGVGAGISVLSGALRDTSNSISNNLIQSAASQSSAAATRGVIAGPTNIPIFQVGAQLEAAMNGTESLLEEILVAIRLGGVGSGGGGSDSSAALVLETTPPSIA